MSRPLRHTASTLAKLLQSNAIMVNAALAELGYIERPTEGYNGPLKHWIPTEKARELVTVVEGKTGKGKGQYWLTWDPIIADELKALCRPALESHIQALNDTLAEIRDHQADTRDTLAALEITIKEIKNKIGGL